MKYILLIVAMSFNTCFAESLGKERIDRLRNSVTRVLIDNVPVGTSFLVLNDNNIAVALTCWHVIEKSYRYK